MVQPGLSGLKKLITTHPEENLGTKIQDISKPHMLRVKVTKPLKSLADVWEL